MSKPITEQKVFLKIAASSIEVSFNRNLWLIVLVWNQRVKSVNVKSVFNCYSDFWLVVFPILMIICSLNPLSISCWQTATRICSYFTVKQKAAFIPSGQQVSPWLTIVFCWLPGWHSGNQQNLFFILHCLVLSFVIGI